MNVTVTDATAAGVETARQLLIEVPSPITLRELVRHRVREEVARHNAAPTAPFHGLVTPAGHDRGFAGADLRKPRLVDWEEQASIALEAFGRNGFFVFVGDEQVDDLDVELTLAETDVVSFVRLMPLVGG